MDVQIVSSPPWQVASIQLTGDEQGTPGSASAPARPLPPGTAGAVTADRDAVLRNTARNFAVGQGYQVTGEFTRFLLHPAPAGDYAAWQAPVTPDPEAGP